MGSLIFSDFFFCQEISDLACSSDNARALITSLKTPRVKKMLDEFVTQILVELHGNGIYSPHVHSGSERGDMGLVLVQFPPHVAIIFFRYDNLNYARWGAVCILEMNQLPKEVLEEFKKGNVVVKWNENKFNQVSPDRSPECLNGIGKRGGGIVGITRTSSALSRWALSYDLRSQIAENTHTMLRLR